MRKVMPSSEVYHLWANETQSDARNSSNTVSFDRDTTYSYRAPIGRIIRNDRGERAYLVATRTWSVTTSGHQSMLRNAIPYGETVFHVHDIDRGDSHQARIDDYISRIAKAELKAKHARKEHSRNGYLSDVQDIIAELRAYCAFFDLDAPAIDTETLVADLEAARKAALQHEREVQAERRARLAIEAAEWVAGRRNSLPWNYPDVLLRVDGDDVETSKGARVPLKHAERLFRIWRNGEVKTGERVGHFAVSAVHGSALQIGCHYITRKEADRFAASQGWIESQAAA